MALVYSQSPTKLVSWGYQHHPSPLSPADNASLASSFWVPVYVGNSVDDCVLDSSDLVGERQFMMALKSEIIVHFMGDSLLHGSNMTVDKAVCIFLNQSSQKLPLITLKFPNSTGSLT